MMLAGGRLLSVEKASRYAGGFDDPARLVNCFAGVSSTGAENVISVHGNAPHAVQWHIEGVEVPAPNHMSDCYSLGGGLISALSAQVMGNSDFAYTASPLNTETRLADYWTCSCAAAAIQTMSIRSAQDCWAWRRNRKVRWGKKGASYLFNYRYSLLGLANDIGISTSGNILNYQDLNFVLNLPTKSAGTFKLFGTAWQDHAYVELDDPDEWESIWDQNNIDVKQMTAIVGMSHRYQFKGKGRNYGLDLTLERYLEGGGWLGQIADINDPRHPIAKTNKEEKWTLDGCYPFVKSDGHKKTSSKALVMAHACSNVILDRIEEALKNGVVGNEDEDW